MKILFLDIDGVVNCKTTTQRHRGVIGIDPYMAFMVAKIQLDTGCEVVLSSTWRLWEDERDEVRRQVVKFIDVTPRLTDVRERGYEIQAWLDAHPEVTRYAILDDDSDMLEHQLPNFFKTSWDTGITEEIAKKVTDHLNSVVDIYGDRCGMGHLGHVKDCPDKKEKCEKCGKVIEGQPAAMAFRNGDPNDPYYFCQECSPNPFDAIL